MKNINPVITQLTEWKLGMYASSYLGNDLYFLSEAINLLKADVGEEWMVKKCKEQNKDWDQLKIKLTKVKKIILKIKKSYDHIQDKKFEKKDLSKLQENSLQKMFKTNFQKYIKQLPLIEEDMYYILVMLLKNTTMGARHINSEAFKVLEHQGMRKLDKTERKPHSEPTR